MGILLTIAAVVFFASGGLYFAVRGGAFISMYLESVRSDPVSVRQLTDQSGTVELVGTARVHEQTDQARFTDTETLIHESQIFEGEGKAGTRKGTDEAKNPFLLEDETGTVLVDPAGATLQMETTSEIRVGLEEKPPDVVAEFLESSVWLDTDAPVSRRYLESRIDPGDDVHVYGPVRDVDHSPDLPPGVDAVISVSDPQEGPVDATELSVSGIKDRFMSDVEQWFVITNGDETAAADKLRYNGLVGVVIGVPLIALAVVIVLIGGV